MKFAFGLGLGMAPLLKGVGVAPVPDLPRTGMISEWRMAEGSGTTVADSQGSNPINLALPTTPNYSWNARGLSTAAGLIQTPSIAGLRTVALLYRVPRNTASGFTFSGGATPGQGILGSQATTHSYWVGGGSGVAPLSRRTSNGDSAYRLNRGGWVLVFIEFASAFTTPIGLGGRHSTTTSRCAAFDTAWAGAWSRTLSDAERTTVYNYVRNLVKARGVYFDYRDCPSIVGVKLLWGQSNADGRAKIVNLSAPDQARSITKTYIQASNGVTAQYPPALLVLGTNQQTTAPTTDFGPEMGMAWRREDAGGGDQYIVKYGRGSTYLASSATGVSASLTWNAGEIESAGLFYFALAQWWDVEQYLLNQGIGPRLDALCFMQGEQDATSTTYSTGYQANLQALYDKVQLYTGYAGVRMVVGRIRNQDPTFNATAVAQVRADQAAFVAANANTRLVDTDTFPLRADLVHYDAAGMKSLGEAFYDQAA